MQNTPTQTLFIIEFDGDNTGGIQATKYIPIPHLPKVDDEFTFEGPGIFASLPVEEVYYNLSANIYQVELDASLTDWWGCTDESLAAIVAELRAQDWTVRA